MAKIKRLVLGLIPNQKCNLKCEYCYISQVEAWEEPEHFKFSPEHIAKCLSKERLGGVSLINLTGNGETMLQPDIVELISALLKEGHFVELVTNGTVTRQINKVLDLPVEWRSHLFFKISFHYKELIRLNMIDKFFDNVKSIHKAGVSFTLELLAYDEIESEIEYIRKVCIENVGEICHATICRNDKRKDKTLLSKHEKSEFRQVWSSLNSEMVEFKLDVIDIKRKEFCYAGAWSFFVNLYTGESQPCYWQPYNQNIFNKPNKPIKFVPVGHTCTQPYCTNAHAHLTWGLIPELETPKYADMRNRVCENGVEWLTTECKEFFSSELAQSNFQYTKSEKIIHTILYPFRLLKWFVRDYKNNIHRFKKYMYRIGR
ncbi:radical SAM protein [Eubacteriaceae bacterium ES2]|nr:radical SAM protein [Eubacteriaceae bacterium ES2]